MIAGLMRAWRKLNRQVTPAEMAAAELADAERELLQWQTQREHADSNVQFNEVRIKRLKKALASYDKETSQ